VAPPVTNDLVDPVPLATRGPLDLAAVGVVGPLVVGRMADINMEVQLGQMGSERSGGACDRMVRSLLRKLGVLPCRGANAVDAADAAQGLLEVQLQHKHITAAQARTLCAALRFNSTILCLKVGCNELGDEVREGPRSAAEVEASCRDRLNCDGCGGRVRRRWLPLWRATRRSRPWTLASTRSVR
jgi:hypothetical protein